MKSREASWLSRIGLALGATVVTALGALSFGASQAVAERGLTVGLTDSVFNGADRSVWLDRADDVRAQTILLAASWTGVAPVSEPSKEEASDPGFAGYNWASVDASVQEAAARGMEPMLLVTGAPAWAEGKNRPGFGEAHAGTWKPSPSKLRDFGRAIASRYSGNFDPDGPLGQPELPRVRNFQLWAEPNLAIYLTPQSKGGKPFAGDHFRKMLRGFYEGVHGAPGSAKVITGGTAPYGDPPPSNTRTQPVLFWREVLCLKGRQALEPVKCSKPAKFDVLSHHPINVGSPSRSAFNPDDASTPDIGRIRRVLDKAERTNRVEPGGKKPIWATEIWWDSKPPDPDGVPEQRHAQYLSESFYRLWKQGVERVIWFQIRDQACSPSCAGSPQTGLFLQNGNPKLAADAFAFPFVANAEKGKNVSVWGLAPDGGDVVIERKKNGNWDTVSHANAGGNRVFAKKFRLKGNASLRARADGETSLPRAVG